MKQTKCWYLTEYFKVIKKCPSNMKKKNPSQNWILIVV